MSCEHATSRVVREERDGRLTVLASHWQGSELNSPNDIVVKSDGAIYFSDPTFGRVRVHIRVFDVQPDGSISNGRVFGETT